MEALGDLPLACRLPCFSSHCWLCPALWRVLCIHVCGRSCLYVQAPNSHPLATLQVKDCLHWWHGQPSGGRTQERSLCRPRKWVWGMGDREFWSPRYWDPGQECGVWTRGFMNADWTPCGAGAAGGAPGPPSWPQSHTGGLGTGALLEKAWRQIWDLCNWWETGPVSTP